MSAPLPPLAPLSRRIQHHAQHMGVVRPLGASARPLEFPFLDIQVELAVQLREETLLAPRTGEPRTMERPAETEGQLGVCTPQFFLRNTMRAVRDSEERSSFQRVTLIPPPDDPGAIIREALSADEPLPELSRDVLRDHLAERAEIMLKPWNARFGRPDP